MRSVALAPDLQPAIQITLCSRGRRLQVYVTGPGTEASRSVGSTAELSSMLAKATLP